MSKRSTTAPSETDARSTREKLIGLGERSIRKTYYPELQQRLRELERFRVLLDNAGDAIFLVEAETGRIHDTNQSACHQLEYENQEVRGSLFLDLLEPGKARDDIAKCFQSKSCRAVSSLQVKLRPKHKPPFFAEMSLRFRRFDKQEYAVIVARDVTPRIAMETALREAEEKYRSIFENAQVGIFQTTVSGRLLSANPALAQILGYPSAAALLSSVDDVGRQIYVDPQERQVFLQKIEDQGMVSAFECRMRRRDGSVIWVRYNAHVIRDKAGGVRYFEGSLQDITEKRLAEEQNRRLEEQLRQAQKMDALGKLTGGIAHDFNNLLQAISGYVQLLLFKKQSADPDRKYLAEINKAADRASDIVRRLLAFSRKMEVRLQPVNLNEIVEATLKIVEHTAPKMVTIKSALDPGLKIIQADPPQLEQVLMNLAFNAVDAMPQGGRLLIETENVTLDSEYRNRYLEIDPGEYVCLKVTDTGHGLDEETRKRIFEPFFTTKDVSKGTGLGLSIVYGIVKGHLGHITCYSEPGVGTTFKVYLPVAERVSEPLIVPRLEDEGSPQVGSETILLVDDEDMILDIGEEMLGRFGYRIVRAGSGEEALSIYRNRREDIDLVVLDLGMPGMGGERCLEELKALDPEVKVIVASGYGAHRIAKDPLAYGASAFISKPYPLKEMLRLVRTLCDAE